MRFLCFAGLATLGLGVACNSPQDPVVTAAPAPESANDGYGHFLPDDPGSGDLLSMDSVTFESLRPMLERLRDNGFITEEQWAEVAANPEGFMKVFDALAENPEAFGIDLEAERAWRDAVTSMMLEGMSMDEAVGQADAQEADAEEARR